ncbi:porin [Mesohalobacter halotolerans]|uniref:Phosphate-selective porin O and P n=1 Tax=Mesohalobacter halotolerans TaxID=1883405 RepID=A0A4U5TS47_9FLAO|nr:porin [Mesohalobacter halotolerans]MBS3738118.1 hypothetical protein [Psychroflexus sp.]TKS57109.1 hypothetical protein FCN74_01445 [Mesohalobacter halotolerans]
MKINKLLLFLGLFVFFTSHGQLKQADTVYYKSIIPVGKQSRLSDIDLIANTNYNLRNDFADGEYIDSRFRFEQFRAELRGYLTPKIYFRFRHRYTSSFEPQSKDKIIKGVDMAYISFKIDKEEKWEAIVGKFSVDWGGIEFDLNPIDVYEYSDIIEQADNFLSGAGIKYFLNKNSYFGFQVYNARTQNYDQLYGNNLIVGSTGIEASKAPLGGVVTWRGSLFNGKLNTLWSYSLTNEASGIFKNYFVLGQQFSLNNFKIAYDFKFSREDLDRTGIISSLIPRDEFGFVLRDTQYMSHWMQVDWEFSPKWHLAFTGFFDNAQWLGDEDPNKRTNQIRDSYGYIPSIEYYPWEDMNLKFFIGYVGRSFRYSSYAQNAINLENKDTGRIILGFISPLKIL